MVRVALGFNAPVGAFNGVLIRAHVLPAVESDLPDPTLELAESSVRLDPELIQRLKSPAPRSRLYGQTDPQPTWRTLVLPPLFVPEDTGDGRRKFAKVRVELVSHTGAWKSNIWIDGVELLGTGGPGEREAEVDAVNGTGGDTGSSSSEAAAGGRSPPIVNNNGTGNGQGWLDYGRMWFRSFFQ